MVKEYTCNVGETQVQTLGWEDFPWRREWQPNASIPSWRIPWEEELGGLQSMWSQRVGHNSATNTLEKKDHVFGVPNWQVWYI